MHEPILAKILRYFVYVCAFVPLIIFSDYISPFHFGKVIILRSLIEIMVVFYLLLIWKDRTYLPKLNIVGWSFFAFAVAFSITTITSVIPYASMWGSLERMGGLFTFWHYFIYFLILTSVFRAEAQWLNLFKLVIGIGVVSAFYGFGQRTDITFFVGSGGRLRIFGTIGNPALFAGYQILCAFLALLLFFKSGSSNNLRLFYGASFIIMIIAGMMTAVRGSVLGIGVGLLAFALLYSSALRSKKAKKILLGLIGLLVVFVMLAVLFKDTSFVQNSGYLKRITNFSLNDYTVKTRFWAWEAGFKGWKENPRTILVGWGPENFNIPFSKYFNPKFFQGPGSETLFDRAHNMFVEVLVTMGLVGFLTYVGIFVIAVKTSWKKLNKSKEEIIYGVGFISLIIAYAIHNSFIFDTSANFLVFFTILGFISFLELPKIHDTKPKPHKHNPTLIVLAGFVLMAVAVFAVYKINILPARANYTTTRAIIAGWNNDFPGAIITYEKAIDFDVPGKYEIRHRFAQYVLEKTNSGKLTPEYIDAINKAITAVKKNIDENEVDYLPYLYVSRLYIILGKEDSKSEFNDKALEYSLKARDLAPTFVRTYYEIGQAYLNKHDFDKAGEFFKIASELNPDVGLSFWYWGVVEIEKGNTALGLELIEDIIKTNRYTPVESDLNRLINIYLKNNDLNKLVWAYEVLVKNHPTNAQYHASLAVAYARAGRAEPAIAEARKAAELDANFEPEARAFVQSLGREW